MPDGRTNKGNKRMSDEEFDFMYNTFKENYDIFNGRSRQTRDRKRVLYQEIIAHSNSAENAINNYWYVYSNLMQGKKLNTPRIGAGILAKYLSRIERDYSEDFLRQCVKIYHYYLTKTHAGERQIWLRDHCQEYSDKLGLGLDFFESVPSPMIIHEQLPEDDSSPSGDSEYREISYQWNVEDLAITKVPAPPFQRKKSFEENDRIRARKADSPEQSSVKAKNKKKIGDQGELAVMRIEREYLCSIGVTDRKPLHIARKKDGYGYDIISFRKNKKEELHRIYIEVKSTSGPIDTPFFVSHNEVEASKEYGSDYYIYRLFDMTEDCSELRYYEVNGDISKFFNLQAQTYLAFRK